MEKALKGPKQNNRRYPGVAGSRPDNAQFRRKEAADRLTAYNALSVQGKIASLDARLGVGVGAVKQRARLAKIG
jgi:hypothetical protein